MVSDSESGLNRQNLRSQLTWYLFFRVLVITLFLGGTIVYRIRCSGTVQHCPPYLHFLVGISYVHALLSAVSLPRVRRLRFFTQTQIVWDLFFCTFLIYITSGIDSLFSSLYIFVIISASVFLSRKEVLLVGAAAAILYGSLLDLQYFGYLPVMEGLFFSSEVDGRDAFYTVFVNVIAFFLTAFLSSLLAERYRKSEQALERREIDYEELENLNRTILANMTSGLMIINSRGRIRSFNAAASKITGFSLQEVYDRDVSEVFTNIQIFNGNEFRVVRRGEARFVDKEGCVRTLGYTSSLVKDPHEKTIGLLVSFQDLTQLKEMEDQLKLADRLAAVGRLASGMAHEIRNPLASISGSVQLLMEGAQVTDEEHRLMEIVVKEADRLSSLLTDFLVFARPKPPITSEVDVSSLLDELISMLGNDPRLAEVEISKEYPAGVKMVIDRQQFHQALWNLVLNGAEAMEFSGVLHLGIEPDIPTIYVEDAGPGIPEEIRGKVFDPFFTTKDKGTGLGLATVYTIVEAHGGEVELAAGYSGGARFVIHLPKRVLPKKS